MANNRSNRRSVRPAFGVEHLESRNLFASATADLVCAVQSINLLAAPPLAGVTTGSIKVLVGNASAEAFAKKSFNKVQINVELVTGASDAKGYSIGHLDNFSVAGLSNKKNLVATIPLSLDARKAKSGAYKIPVGTYKIRVTVDSKSQVVEGDETNNAALSTQSETLKAPFADLGLASFQTNYTTNSTSGAKGQAQVVIQNLGNITANGKFDVLVTTTRPDLPDAIVVGVAKKIPISLAPNKTFTLPAKKLLLQLPANTAGRPASFLFTVTLTPSGIKGDVASNNKLVSSTKVTVPAAPTTSTNPIVPSVGSGFTFTLKKNFSPNNDGITNEIGTVVDNKGRTGTYDFITTVNNPPLRAGQTLFLKFPATATQPEVAIHYTKMEIKDSNGGLNGALPGTLNGLTLQFGVSASVATGQVSFKDINQTPTLFKIA